MPESLVIADKVAAHRIVLQVRLRGARHAIELVADLAALLTCLSRTPGALVVLDCNVVETDLATDIARIRAAAPGRSLPVVVTAGEDSAITAADVLEAGGDDFHRRPVMEHLLMARVRSLLRARETTEECARRRATAEHFGFSEAAPGFRTVPRLAIVAADRSGPDLSLATALPSWTRRLTPRQALNLEDPASAPELLFLPLSEATANDRLPLLSELRTRAATRHAAIIVLVPPGAQRLAAQALDLGAGDVTQADADKREISHRLHRQLALKREADTLRRTIDDGFRAATTDGLTGLYNRRYAETHLHRLHKEAATSGRSYALIMADIDMFKQVNDNHGHPAGDVVLKTFAKRLRSALRGPDLLARYGGEEFLALLPQTGREGARIVAERLAQITRAQPVPLPDGTDVTITASFGVAVVPPYGALQQVIPGVDAALYAAKAKGRDRVELAPDLPPAPPWGKLAVG